VELSKIVSLRKLLTSMLSKAAELLLYQNRISYAVNTETKQKWNRLVSIWSLF